MTRPLYRYTFEKSLDLESVEETLLLAFLSASSLHGEATVRLEGKYYFDRVRRRCVIDANSVVGRDLNLLFTGFLQREFGKDAFNVERVGNHPLDSQANGHTNSEEFGGG